MLLRESAARHLWLRRTLLLYCAAAAVLRLYRSLWAAALYLLRCVAGFASVLSHRRQADALRFLRLCWLHAADRQLC